MSKRCQAFTRNERDYYPTPESAVVPLCAHIRDIKSFAEPCAGDGRLSSHIYRLSGARPYWESDIEPQSAHIHQADALEITRPLAFAGCIITNPPWERKTLHKMIEHFRALAPTWLLFDADWMHTKQAVPYLKYCHKIVSVGRVSWSGNGTASMDNCAWYQFGLSPRIPGGPVFYPKTMEGEG